MKIMEKKDGSPPLILSRCTKEEEGDRPCGGESERLGGGGV
jgi:hypothetical protein